MPAKYAAERTIPRHPACAQSRISLVFDGRILSARGTLEAMTYPAVSGRPLALGRFDYSVDRQKVPDAGPIPEGEYWIQPSQLQANAWYRVRNPRTAWGDYWITIHPYPSTSTHGRGGFFVHGGHTPGSAGCIDLSIHMNRFIEAIKKELRGLPECFIPLTVRYPK